MVRACSWYGGTTKCTNSLSVGSLKGSDHLGESVVEGNNIKISFRRKSLLKCEMN